MVASIIIPMAVVLGLALVIAVVVYFAFRLRSGEPINISFRLLLTAYFYLLTIAGLIVLLVGLSGLVNAGLGAVLGRDFSYTRPPIARPIPVTPEGVPQKTAPSPEEQRLQAERQQERQSREGLLQGGSMAVIGGIVWALHSLGRRRMEEGEERAASFLRMGYLLVLLAVSSLVSMITLSSGVFETLRFYLVESVNEFEFRSPPGQNVSAAVVFTPVWAYYLLALLRGLRRGRGP